MAPPGACVILTAIRAGRSGLPTRDPMGADLPVLDAFLQELAAAPADAAPGRTVALDAGAPVTLRRLLALAEAVAERIEAAEVGPGERIALAFGRDRLAFAAALLGAWMTGRGVTVPATAAREYVFPSTFDRSTGLLLHDTGVGRGIDVGALAAAPTDREPRGRRPEPPEQDALIAVELDPCPTLGGSERPPFTGFADLVLRSWSREQVDREVRALLPAVEGSGAVVTTLAPCSLPGLLLGTLAPLALGRPFLRFTPADPEALGRCLSELPGATLVATPAHLRGLVEGPAEGLGSLAAVIAAWQPLDDELGAALADRVGGPVRAALVWEKDGESAARLKLQAALAALDGVVDAEVLAGGGGPLAVFESPSLDEAAVAAAVAGPAVPAGTHFLRLRGLARDPNGLLPARSLRRRLGLDSDDRPLPRDFHWSEPLETEGDTRAALVDVPADSAWFPGHFPSYPVLAGAVQLEALVLPVFQALAPAGARVTGFGGLKFLAPIRPGDQIRIDVALDDSSGGDRSAATFTIRDGATTLTAGRLTYVVPTPGANLNGSAG